jgi:hypothetical protein
MQQPPAVGWGKTFLFLCLAEAKNGDMKSRPFSRRDFLHATAAEPKSPKLIGIQVGAVSFLDKGTEGVLDLCANALLLSFFLLRTGAELIKKVAELGR